MTRILGVLFGAVCVLTAVPGLAAAFLAPVGAAAPVINAKNFPGVICDGVTRTPNDGPGLQESLDAAFGPSNAPHGVHSNLNIPWHLSGGHCIITAPLTLRSVRSGVLYGDGPLTSEIENIAGGNVYSTNGFQYSTVSGLHLRISGPATTGTVFDLNWDGNPPVGLDANTFQNLLLEQGAYNVNIGADGFMGSENQFIQVQFQSAGTACLKVSNFNALNNILFGGSMESCQDGVDINEGGVSIFGTAFSNSVDYDVEQENNSQTTVLEGIRTESKNFYHGAPFNRVDVVLSGIVQDNANSGTLAYVGGYFTINDSSSLKGQVVALNSGSITNSQFGRLDWINISGATNDAPTVVTAENVNFNTSGRYTKIVSDRWVGNYHVSPVTKAFIGQTAYLDIPPGSGSTTLQIPPNSRVLSVKLILDVAGSRGTINVGDGRNSARYFSAHSLTGSNAVSTVTDFLYSSSGVIIATSSSAIGVKGYVAVEYQVLN